MTCKRAKIISGDSDDSFSFIYNYAFLPMVIIYLCIPIVTLVKYIFNDIMKVYNAETKKDLNTCYETDELIKAKVENALLKSEIQQRKYIRDMLGVLKNYEYTLQRFVEEHKKVLSERDALQEMLHVIEDDYQSLNGKYTKAKEVIDGLEQSEQSLRRSLQEWENTMLEIEDKYETLKGYTVDKKPDNNNRMKLNDSEYKRGICKLKSKVVEGQIKINETEVSTMSSKKNGLRKKNSNYIFEPLVSNI